MEEEVKELIKPIEIKREDTCPACTCEKALELYSLYGKRMNYGLMCYFKRLGNDNEWKSMLNEKPAYTLKCRVCGETYLIYWDNGFPRPLLFKPYLSQMLKMYGY